VSDILPTILDVTGVSALSEREGDAVQAIQGESFLPLLKGESWSREAPIFFEHEGNAAIRMGRFKLVRQYDQEWELYDMETDRTELTNLAGRIGHAEHDLHFRYQRWAEAQGVMDWDVALPKLLSAWGIETAEG
jgi:arylsulfatase